MDDQQTADQTDDMATGLATNDQTTTTETPWYDGETYADLDDDAKRIAPKYATESEAAKAGLNAQRLINRKVQDMLTANPGLLKESGLETGAILKELGAVTDVESLAEYGGPPADDYSQAIKDAYDPKEEAALKGLCAEAGLLPQQVKALFEYREKQMRQLDRLLREKQSEARRVGDAQKAEFQQREGWAGDLFAKNMTLAERAARQFGNDELADSVKGMAEGKQPFNGAMVNILHELAQARTQEGQTITGEREKAGSAKANGSVFSFPEMDT